MNQKQKDFYKSLPGLEKTVLKLAALKAEAIDESEIKPLLGMLRISSTQKLIKSVLDRATSHALFIVEGMGYYKKYSASPDLMVHVFPEMQNMSGLWKMVRGNEISKPFFSRPGKYAAFRDCLYTLINMPEDYAGYESYFYTSHRSFLLQCYNIIFQDGRYERYLPRVNGDIVSQVLNDVMSIDLQKLKPFAEIRQFVGNIYGICKISDTKLLDDIDKASYYFHGNFSKAIEMNNGNGSIVQEMQAVKALSLGKTDEALTFFDNIMTAQQKAKDKIPVPHNSTDCEFFFFTTLFSMDARTAAPYFQKMDSWILKKKTLKDVGFSTCFIPAVLYATGKRREEYSSYIEAVITDLNKDEISFYSLIHILAFYLANEKITEPKLEPILFEIAQKGFEAGVWILTYELLYALKSWYDSPRIERLYQTQAEQMSYQPMLSQIVRQEDWEKNLNLLLAMKNISTKKKEVVEENKNRVVYFFDPDTYEIQPMLQTRRAAGWSQGRNIALKTLFDGLAKGMSEQDKRIARTIEFHNSYYDSYFAFSEKALTAMIGHPYIFLKGAVDVSVEFVAAQPVIKVSNELRGYTLSSDVKTFKNNIVAVKETNTRYRIYDLTNNQKRIIEIINEPNITIPEKGKDKLIELLGVFSSEGMVVHSDLLATDNAQVTIKEVQPDARIRVQLLPFGDGLRAELFVKPFGDRPPYCKPAKGGKALISNEDDIQLQVKRDFSRERANEATIMADIQNLDSVNMSDELISFDEPLDSLNLLDILRNHNDICVTEWPEGERYKLRGTVGRSNLKLNISSGIGWFEVDGELRVDENTVLSLQQLLALSDKSKRRFVELSDGEFLALTKELKKQLEELRLFSTMENDRLKLNKFASVALNDLFENVGDLQADKLWQIFRRNLEASSVTDIPVPAGLNAELRSYQEEGFRWMARLASWEGGACLADDMGLGKTVQALAILLHRAAAGPGLVVCPVSVIGNWIGEVKRFAPTLNIKTLNQSVDSRKEVIDGLEAGDLLITSYGLLQSEEKLMAEPKFATVVLDEAHIIKNNATKTSKATMQLKASFRLALTGTPVQNHLGEIWNLFNFINPGLLGSLQHFNDCFVKTNSERSNKHLKKLIAPFILRRTKTAVLDELPPKTEIAKIVQLSDEEMAFYESLRRKAVENLDKSKGNANHIQVLAEITKLRQASCNPALIDPSTGIHSSKMATFLDIVHELMENKHRALVFSQFVSHLALVRKELDNENITYQYIDGSTPANVRQESVKQFQSGQSDLFLISLKAGGLGLNLTTADFVIHLDPWWNPAVEDQASDRAHRIGQQRPVTIYRLIAENTIEEKIIKLHGTKRNMVESLLEGTDMAAKLSVNELMDLIKGR